jgi:hypothetical protein
MLIFMVSQGFDSEVCGIEEASVYAPPAKTAVRVNFANEENPFTLLWDTANLFELAAEKPEVAKEYRFAHGNRGHNQINQKQGV